jgi:hypothetical protein
VLYRLCDDEDFVDEKAGVVARCKCREEKGGCARDTL